MKNISQRAILKHHKNNNPKFPIMQIGSRPSRMNKTEVKMVKARTRESYGLQRVVKGQVIRLVMSRKS